MASAQIVRDVSSFYNMPEAAVLDMGACEFVRAVQIAARMLLWP